MGLGIPLIVIVIFLVVWIVSNVIRAQQDANQAAVRRNNAGNRVAGPPRAENKGGSDIDRFLQEIDRLRKKGQQEKTQQQDESAAAPPPPPPKPKPVGDRRSEPARVRTGAPRPPREPRPAAPKPPTSTRSPAPIVAELLEAPPPPPPGPTLTSKPGSLASSIEAKAESARLAAEAASRAAPGADARTTNPARRLEVGNLGSLPATLQIIQKLFKTQQGIAAAVLLHEIFGPPRSMRG